MSDLEKAIKKNDVNLVKRILDSGVNFNVKDSRGNTPLDNALMSGNIKIVKILLDSGATLRLENIRKVNTFELSNEVKSKFKNMVFKFFNLKKNASDRKIINALYSKIERTGMSFHIRDVYIALINLVYGHIEFSQKPKDRDRIRNMTKHIDGMLRPKFVKIQLEKIKQEKKRAPKKSCGGLTVKQLKEKAKAKKLKGYSRMNKKELCLELGLKF